MSRFQKNTGRIRRLLILLPILAAVILIADAIYISRFNAEVHTASPVQENAAVSVAFAAREDSTSSWVKQNADVNGETADLTAQIYDGTIINGSGYQMADWTFTLRLNSACYINQAWCGTMEIHQCRDTEEEKVQTLDLRNYNREDVTLDCLNDSDLLIALEPGDYVVYYPSAEVDETPIPAGNTVTMGIILYYQEEPDLSGCLLSWHYSRSWKDCGLFYAGMVIALVWLLLLLSYIVSRVSYQAAVHEEAVKRSGISAMSDIYSIIYIADLQKNELIPITADKESERLRPKERGAQEQLKNLFEWDSEEIYLDAVLKFCDLSTIAERLAGRNTIVCEYVSRTHGWCQLRFFTMERGSRNEPVKVIFAIQVINVEKAELESLSAAVQEKTENIIDMQQKLVVGMANMIENRDGNTGGHVKRTSDVVGIIVGEIQKQGIIPIDSRLADDIIKAAPLHDIGKVSIDSSILCKPGRLTPEEYAVMKTHAAKSGELVRLLLDGIEEEHLVSTAWHIARFHHERWDGRGYPDGLKGEEIPIEARIMAVADVYDALVSKRCYKEAMSFAQASETMLEGMGSQFDPRMKAVFLGCRETLEAYYRDAESEEQS